MLTQQIGQSLLNCELIRVSTFFSLLFEICSMKGGVGATVDKCPTLSFTTSIRIPLVGKMSLLMHLLLSVNTRGTRGPVMPHLFLTGHEMAVHGRGLNLV